MRLAQAILLVLLSLLMSWFLWSERIYFYIHERSVWLVALTVPCLLVMAYTRLRRRGGVQAGSLAVAILAMPLALAVLVPAQPLGAAAMQFQKPSGTTVSPRVPEIPLSWSAGSLDLDLRRLGELSLRDRQLQALEGQRASLLGFVYRLPDLPADRFIVGRYIIRCCTADAVPLNFPVRFQGADAIPTDTWVEVTGVIRHAEDGLGLPFVDAEHVRIVPQPTRPYLTS